VESHQPTNDGQVFFISSTVELHADFVVNVLGAVNSRREFDDATYFVPASRRRFLALSLTRLNDTMVSFAYWPTDEIFIDEVFVLFFSHIFVFETNDFDV
jgi:hypothetical protein